MENILFKTISKGEYKKYYIDKLRCCLILFKGDSGGEEAFPCPPSLVSFRTSQKEEANKQSSSTAFSSAPALTSHHYGLLHGGVR